MCEISQMEKTKPKYYSKNTKNNKNDVFFLILGICWLSETDIWIIKLWDYCVATKNWNPNVAGKQTTKMALQKPEFGNLPTLCWLIA